MKTKLTLRLDKDLIRKAKRLARRRNTSVSQMVADFFDLLNRQSEPINTDDTAVEHSDFTKSLMGVAADVGIGTGAADHRQPYYRHLEEKHQ